MKKENTNKVVITLLVLIIIILLVLCILFATGTISFKSNTVDNNEINQNISDNGENNSNTINEGNSLDTNGILEKLNGVWGYGYYMISIQKDNKQYLQGQYGTDGGIGGTISNIKELSNNKYELEVFIKGCSSNDCVNETEDATKIILIEIDSTKNIIVNNNNEYQFITKEHSDYDTIDAYFNK